MMIMVCSSECLSVNQHCLQDREFVEMDLPFNGTAGSKKLGGPTSSPAVSPAPIELATSAGSLFSSCCRSSNCCRKVCAALKD